MLSPFFILFFLLPKKTQFHCAPHEVVFGASLVPIQHVYMVLARLQPD